MADCIQRIKRIGRRQQVVVSASNRREAINHFPGYDALAADDRQIVQRVQTGEQRSALLHANNNFHLLEHEPDGYVAWTIVASELCQVQTALCPPIGPRHTRLFSACVAAASAGAIVAAIWCSAVLIRVTTSLAENSRQLERTAASVSEDRKVIRDESSAMLSALSECGKRLQDESTSRILFSEHLGKLVEQLQQ
jgi:hypothetical protein